MDTDTAIRQAIVAERNRIKRAIRDLEVSLDEGGGMIVDAHGNARKALPSERAAKLAQGDICLAISKRIVDIQ